MSYTSGQVGSTTLISPDVPDIKSSRRLSNATPRGSLRRSCRKKQGFLSGDSNDRDKYPSGWHFADSSSLATSSSLDDFGSATESTLNDNETSSPKSGRSIRNADLERLASLAIHFKDFNHGNPRLVSSNPDERLRSSVLGSALGASRSRSQSLTGPNGQFGQEDISGNGQLKQQQQQQHQYPQQPVSNATLHRALRAKTCLEIHSAIIRRSQRTRLNPSTTNQACSQCPVTGNSSCACVDGVYNPLQVIRDRLVRERLGQTLKAPDNLNIPPPASTVFTRTKRKLLWEVTVPEEIADLGWRVQNLQYLIDRHGHFLFPRKSDAERDRLSRSNITDWPNNNRGESTESVIDDYAYGPKNTSIENHINWTNDKAASQYNSPAIAFSEASDETASDRLLDTHLRQSASNSLKNEARDNDITTNTAAAAASTPDIPAGFSKIQHGHVESQAREPTSLGGALSKHKLSRSSPRSDVLDGGLYPTRSKYYLSQASDDGYGWRADRTCSRLQSGTATSSVASDDGVDPKAAVFTSHANLRSSIGLENPHLSSGVSDEDLSRPPMISTVTSATSNDPLSRRLAPVTTGRASVKSKPRSVVHGEGLNDLAGHGKGNKTKAASRASSKTNISSLEGPEVDNNVYGELYKKEDGQCHSESYCDSKNEDTIMRNYKALKRIEAVMLLIGTREIRNKKVIGVPPNIQRVSEAGADIGIEAHKYANQLIPSTISEVNEMSEKVNKVKVALTDKYSTSLDQLLSQSTQIINRTTTTLAYDTRKIGERLSKHETQSGILTGDRFCLLYKVGYVALEYTVLALLWMVWGVVSILLLLKSCLSVLARLARFFI